MSLQLYDNALLAKFQRWTKDTATNVLGVNQTSRLFETLLDTQKDKKLDLPIIALSRPGGFRIIDKFKQPKTYNSLKFTATPTSIESVNIIQIAIPYQIDVYARYQEEADEYIRNIVFNIINYPKVQVEIPYEDVHRTHDSNIQIASDVEDNSDIPERLIPGQFTRYTLGISVEDAYLFDVRIRDKLSIVEGSIATPDMDKELVFEK